MNWIKVSDELPKENQRVIYYFEPLGIFRGKYKTVNSIIGNFDLFYSNRGWLYGDVTHWMPDLGQELPDPPMNKE